MSYQEVLRDHVIAVSASESPDMGYLGLSEKHLHDAMTEIARHLLALGAQLSYGGDLRGGGFSELLFELVQRHRRDVEEESLVGITNFLAWPVHLSMSFEDIDLSTTSLKGIAELVCLDMNGTRMPLLSRQQITRREPSAAEWRDGLTAMRRAIQAGIHARIVLGGSIDNFRGSMPGVAEESLVSLEAGTPLFVLGGFGGCARDVAETLGLADPWAPLNRAWPERVAFSRFGADSLNNGLTMAENRVLAKTPHIDQAIILILKGLVSIDT